VDDPIIYQMLLWTTQSYTKCSRRRPNHIPNALVDDPIIYQMLLWTTQSYTKCSCGRPWNHIPKLSVDHPIGPSLPYTPYMAALRWNYSTALCKTEIRNYFDIPQVSHVRCVIPVITRESQLMLRPT